MRRSVARPLGVTAAAAAVSLTLLGAGGPAAAGEGRARPWPIHRGGPGSGRRARHRVVRPRQARRGEPARAVGPRVGDRQARRPAGRQLRRSRQGLPSDECAGHGQTVQPVVGREPQVRRAPQAGAGRLREGGEGEGPEQQGGRPLRPRLRRCLRAREAERGRRVGWHRRCHGRPARPGRAATDGRLARSHRRRRAVAEPGRAVEGR